MKQYNNLSELILDKDNYPEDGKIFIEKFKMNDKKNATFWVLTKEDLEDRKPYLMLPNSIKDFDAVVFFDTMLFRYLINEMIRCNTSLKLEHTNCFLEAIELSIANNDIVILYNEF